MRILLTLSLIVLCLTFASAQKSDRCKSCLITMDFRPVCGTNGLTYDNLSELECSDACEGYGTPVRLRHTGACQPPNSKGHAPHIFDSV